MKISNNTSGAFCITLSMGAYVTNDALIKLAAEDVVLSQAIFVRGTFASIIILIIATLNGKRVNKLGRKTLKFVYLRILGEVGSTYCFLYAVINMPLANATAILQSIPIAITLAAAIFLNERVGWRRWISIIIGFLGVLIIIRPGTSGFNEFSLFALAAVAFIVLRDLSTRNIPSNIPSIIITLISTISISIVAGIHLFISGWNELAHGSLLFLGGAAIFLSLGSILNVITMRIGDVSFTAPFRYSLLIWAIVLGIYIFDETPDLSSLFGSIIVALSGVYIFHREFKHKN